MLFSQHKGTELLPTFVLDRTWWEERALHPGWQRLVSETRDEAERLIKRPAPQLTDDLFCLFEETGSRKEYEAVYFHRRHRMNTFAFMTLIHSEKKQYKQALRDEVEDVCSEYSWCLPAHIKDDDPSTIDLFAAETSFALSEMKSILGTELGERLCRRIEEEVRGRVLQPFLNHTYHWETVDHNWAAVCAGSVGAAAMHLLEEGEVLDAILERNVRTMDYFLSGFNEDGVCLEGYQYWQYGFGFFVYFADLLLAHSGGHINLFQRAGVGGLARFQQKAFLYRSKVVSFSDCVPEQAVHLGLSHYLHHCFSDVTVPDDHLRAPYTDDHCARWAPLLREWIWFDDTLQGRKWEDKDEVMASSQWVVSRFHADTDHYAFAAKGGHNDEPHNHNDVGQMIMMKNGEAFLKDLGAGLYQKGYFDEKRYTFITNHARGHSLPVINGIYQTEGRERKAVQTNVLTENARLVYGLELGGTYPVSGLTSFHRTFIWHKQEKPVLEIHDAFDLEKAPADITEQFILGDLLWTQKTSGVIAAEGMHIYYDPSQMHPVLSREYFMNHDGEKEFYQCLKLHARNPTQTGIMKIAFSFS
ncbi:heparinase II/III family protein [Salibacterium halotolerans]|uniref:Heparinase II/III-like protein n=1 Tax=Salibacterium halotolerans TaxID=1884432 RepID=A0A1I5PJD9_9BACI|nr:heparinase II/III family protein [Salibacterium halotolerans]SFP33920.1 Heparinase II/III-like protein [Salibacterium halotolerans]